MGIFGFLETTTKNLFILAFATIFLLAGLGISGLGVMSEFQQHARLAAACQTHAVVLSSAIGTKGSGGDRNYVPEIRYQYTVHGKNYTGQRVYPGISGFRSGHGYADSERMVLDYPKGKKCHIWYEADNPQIAFLVPRYTWTSIFLMLFGIPFFVAGLVFIIGPLRGGFRRAEMIAASRMNL